MHRSVVYQECVIPTLGKLCSSCVSKSVSGLVRGGPGISLKLLEPKLDVAFIVSRECSVVFRLTC